MVWARVGLAVVNSLAKATKGLSKRKPVKKRNERPQTGMKTVTLNSNRTIAKDYKASTGKSLRASSNEFKSSNVYKSGNVKFKEGYKKPTKRLTEGYLNKKEKAFEQRISKVLQERGLLKPKKFSKK